MILRRRRSGSERASRPIELAIVDDNTGGQGGVPYVTLFDRDGDVYFMLELGSAEEWKQMLSEVQKAGMHVK